MYDLVDSPYLHNFAPYRGKFTFLPRFLLFFALFYGAVIIASIPLSIATMAIYMEDVMQYVENAMTGVMTPAEFSAQLTVLMNQALAHPLIIAISSFTMIFTVAAVIVYVLWIEKRPLRSIGVLGGARHVLLTALCGFALGLLLPLISIGICYLLGAVRVTSAGGHLGWVALFFLAFLVEALADSLLYRGFFLSIFLRPGRSPWFAILFVSLFHIVMQVGPGSTVFGVVNAALVSLILTVLTLRTGSVWLATMFSAVWNTLLVTVFGGSQIPTLFRILGVEGKELMAGSTDATSAGLVMTIVLLIVFGLSLFLPSWRHGGTRPRFTVYTP